MSRFIDVSSFKHDSPGKTGVLLINLGTPDAPTPAALRRYLAEFLSDPRVVEIPRLIWWLILHGIILRFRPAKSAHAYEQIWTEHGSPLLLTTELLAEKLHNRLQQQLGEHIRVDLAMRYGHPAVQTVMEKMQSADVRRLLVIPLYPQYAASSTASACDAVFAVMQRLRWQPELRIVQHYHDHPAYIQALKQSIEAHWAEHGKPDRLLLSFHGVPEFQHHAGDPYYCECHTTARLLRDALSLTDETCQLAFQSRFGKAEWLKPYTSETLKQWGQSGIKSVDVVCPGFAVDCLETLEEIAMQNRDLYLEAGGREFHYIEALNTRDEHIDLLGELVKTHVAGWPDTFSPDQQAAKAHLARAREKGAEY